MKDSENNYIKTNKIPGYNELVESMETVAQEATSQQILTAVQGIDTSDLAKQGSNPDTSLTGIDEKIDDFYDTFDADIALQLQGIIGDTEESVSGTSQTATQVEELRTLQESYDELADKTADSQEILTKLQNIIDAHIINSITVNGYTFESSFTASGIGDIYANMKHVQYINDETTEDISIDSYFRNNNVLKTISYTNLINNTAAAFSFANCPLLEQINMPKLYRFSHGMFSYCTSIENATFPSAEIAWTDMFNGCANLKELHLPKIGSIRFTGFSSCPKLICIELGNSAETFGTINLSAWSPTEALSSESSSLVGEGETFANNLEKLLYNIREHIAANLPDRTGLASLTITFSAAVKAAINADAATAEAFTNKNWTIA